MKKEETPNQIDGDNLNMDSFKKACTAEDFLDHFTNGGSLGTMSVYDTMSLKQKLALVSDLTVLIGQTVYDNISGVNRSLFSADKRYRMGVLIDGLIIDLVKNNYLG